MAACLRYGCCMVVLFVCFATSGSIHHALLLTATCIATTSSATSQTVWRVTHHHATRDPDSCATTCATSPGTIYRRLAATRYSLYPIAAHTIAIHRPVHNAPTKYTSVLSSSFVQWTELRCKYKGGTIM